jgi:hypothetical protein
MPGTEIDIAFSQLVVKGLSRKTVKKNNFKNSMEKVASATAKAHIKRANQRVSVFFFLLSIRILSNFSNNIRAVQI